MAVIKQNMAFFPHSYGVKLKRYYGFFFGEVNFQPFSGQWLTLVYLQVKRNTPFENLRQLSGSEYNFRKGEHLPLLLLIHRKGFFNRLNCGPLQLSDFLCPSNFTVPGVLSQN